MLSYLIFTLTLCAIYGLLALSLNLIWGGAGLVNLGLLVAVMLHRHDAERH